MSDQQKTSTPQPAAKPDASAQEKRPQSEQGQQDDDQTLGAETLEERIAPAKFAF